MNHHQSHGLQSMEMPCDCIGPKDSFFKNQMNKHRLISSFNVQIFIYFI